MATGGLNGVVPTDLQPKNVISLNQYTPKQQDITKQLGNLNKASDYFGQSMNGTDSMSNALWNKNTEAQAAREAAAKGYNNQAMNQAGVSQSVANVQNQISDRQLGNENQQMMSGLNSALLQRADNSAGKLANTAAQAGNLQLNKQGADTSLFNSMQNADNVAKNNALQQFNTLSSTIDWTDEGSVNQAVQALSNYLGTPATPEMVKQYGADYAGKKLKEQALSGTIDVTDPNTIKLAEMYTGKTGQDAIDAIQTLATSSSTIGIDAEHQEALKAFEGYDVFDDKSKKGASDWYLKKNGYETKEDWAAKTGNNVEDFDDVLDDEYRDAASINASDNAYSYVQGHSLQWAGQSNEEILNSNPELKHYIDNAIKAENPELFDDKGELIGDNAKLYNDAANAKLDKLKEAPTTAQFKVYESSIQQLIDNGTITPEQGKLAITGAKKAAYGIQDINTQTIGDTSYSFDQFGNLVGDDTGATGKIVNGIQTVTTPDGVTSTANGVSFKQEGDGKYKFSTDGKTWSDVTDSNYGELVRKIYGTTTKFEGKPVGKRYDYSNMKVGDVPEGEELNWLNANQPKKAYDRREAQSVNGKNYYISNGKWVESGSQHGGKVIS